MLIETRTSNDLRMDYPQRHYDQLEDLMQENNMPAKYVSHKSTLV